MHEGGLCTSSPKTHLCSYFSTLEENYLNQGNIGDTKDEVNNRKNNSHIVTVKQEGENMELTEEKKKIIIEGLILYRIEMGRRIDGATIFDDKVAIESLKDKMQFTNDVIKEVHEDVNMNRMDKRFIPTKPSFFIEWNKTRGQYEIVDDEKVRGDV